MSMDHVSRLVTANALMAGREFGVMSPFALGDAQSEDSVFLLEIVAALPVGLERIAPFPFVQTTAAIMVLASSPDLANVLDLGKDMTATRPFVPSDAQTMVSVQ